MKRMPTGLWTEVMLRADWACARCGHVAQSVHHRLPRSRGGPHDLFNLVALCGDGTRGCHGWVEHNPEAAREDGWTVPGQIGKEGYTGPDEDYRAQYGDARRAA